MLKIIPIRKCFKTNFLGLNTRWGESGPTASARGQRTVHEYIVDVRGILSLIEHWIYQTTLERQFTSVLQSYAAGRQRRDPPNAFFEREDTHIPRVVLTESTNTQGARSKENSEPPLSPPAPPIFERAQDGRWNGVQQYKIGCLRFTQR